MSRRHRAGTALVWAAVLSSAVLSCLLLAALVRLGQQVPLDIAPPSTVQPTLTPAPVHTIVPMPSGV